MERKKNVFEKMMGCRPKKKVRFCLYCERPFLSTGPGNRHCSKCSKDLNRVFVRTPLKCFSSYFFSRMREGGEQIDVFEEEKKEK